MNIEKKNDIRFVDGSVYETFFDDFRFLKKGKVRDIYEVGEQHLLIVATDRLSAFDVVLKQPIPDKGRILTKISNFWFKRTNAIIPNHISKIKPESLFSSHSLFNKIKEQIVIVDKLQPIKFEAVVRGYLAGTAWSDYLSTGSVSGVKLRKSLNKYDRLDKPIFTPSTKAMIGSHDENIGYHEMVETLGQQVSQEIKRKSIALYQEAFKYSASRGIILADTKFEFGFDLKGNLILIDEVFTPDSSRFWNKATYGKSLEPLSFDKQFIRDYLIKKAWDRKESIDLPPEIIRQTSQRYKLALEKLTTAS